MFILMLAAEARAIAKMRVCAIIRQENYTTNTLYEYMLRYRIKPSSSISFAHYSGIRADPLHITRLMRKYGINNNPYRLDDLLFIANKFRISNVYNPQEMLELSIINHWYGMDNIKPSSPNQMIEWDKYLILNPISLQPKNMDDLELNIHDLSTVINRYDYMRR